MQIFRNKVMLPIIFVLPVVQLLVLSYTATFEVKNIKLDVCNLDQSTYSRQLVSKFKASPYFTCHHFSPDEDNGKDLLRQGKVDMVMCIPPHFQRNFVTQQHGQIQLLVNAINGSAAALMNIYASQIIGSFNNNVRVEWLNIQTNSPPLSVINTTTSYWFNPTLDYKTFMVPGILVLLVTMVGMFLSGMSIVKEKEIGTIEQLNVTPIKKYQFIIGKLFPFWIIGIVELAIGLFVGISFFHIPVVGSLWVVFLFTAIYLPLILGMGFFISTFTQTQQQAMFLTWFFMVIFILMSGLFTPIESMPHWAQVITDFNPIKYFVAVMRLILLKGAGMKEISKILYILIAYGIGINALAVINYRKTS